VGSFDREGQSDVWGVKLASCITRSGYRVAMLDWSPDPGRVDALRPLRLRVASIPYTLGGVRMPPWLLSYRSKERNDGKRVDLSSGAGRRPGPDPYGVALIIGPFNDSSCYCVRRSARWRREIAVFSLEDSVGAPLGAFEGPLQHSGRGLSLHAGAIAVLGHVRRGIKARNRRPVARSGLLSRISRPASRPARFQIHVAAFDLWPFDL